MKPSARESQAKLRKAHNLPYRCECGGLMVYVHDFGRIFSHCKQCTPVVKVRVP